MTCRIERVPTPHGLVVRISGRITRDDLQLVRAALGADPLIAIDLTEVELVDRDVVRLLAHLETNGAVLRHCPAYIQEWIAREREGL